MFILYARTSVHLLTLLTPLTTGSPLRQRAKGLLLVVAPRYVYNIICTHVRAFTDTFDVASPRRPPHSPPPLLSSRRLLVVAQRYVILYARTSVHLLTLLTPLMSPAQEGHREGKRLA
jgi:hypothetical protein